MTLLMFLFVSLYLAFLESQTRVVNSMQGKIKEAFLTVPQTNDLEQKTSDPVEDDSNPELLNSEQNFDSLLSTIVWFIEQDPYTNIAMNLDVNYCKVQQENFKMVMEGRDMLDEIWKEEGKTFQNSCIHLLFYEKNLQEDLHRGKPGLNMPLEISLLSLCKLKEGVHPDEWSHRQELRIFLSETTAQFVLKEQYEQLLFVLGQKPDFATRRGCREILELFNDFPTNTPKNFKAMLHQLQFPFVYDDTKSLAVNRHDFKDFFSCLTNIRCAVVEGGHHIEAASWTLQGYKLLDPIPLEQNNVELPENSTMFWKLPMQVYYPKDENQELDANVLEYLQKISEEIYDDKKMVIETSWHNFFNSIILDITSNLGIMQNIYETAEEFFQDDVKYRDFSDKNVKSNVVKKHLHILLTNAIFNYCPCKDLWLAIPVDARPKWEVWGGNANKWLSFSADPYHQVSKFSSKICYCSLSTIFN